MGKKTSVYLTDEMVRLLDASGRSLPEVIRTGLGMSPSMPSRADILHAVKQAVAEGLADVPQITREVEAAPEQDLPGVPQHIHPDGARRLTGAIFGEPGENVRERPRPVRRLPAMDRRLLTATEGLVTEWSAQWASRPDDTYIETVKAEIRGLLERGVVPADISMGIAQWWADPDPLPGHLPEVVEQVAEGDQY